MLSIQANETQILELIRHFFRLASANRLDDACTLLDEPNDSGVKWTPESILMRVYETFGPGTLFSRLYPEGPQFSNPDDLEERADRQEILPLDDGSGYSCWFDVPLNGEWSDLTAQFTFRKRPNGLATILDDLHVL